MANLVVLRVSGDASQLLEALERVSEAARAVATYAATRLVTGSAWLACMACLVTCWFVSRDRGHG